LGDTDKNPEELTLDEIVKENAKRLKDKPCRKCKATDRFSSGGCRPCGIRYRLEYRFKNHKKVLEKERQYRKRNLEKVREAIRKWHRNNPEKSSAKDRRWRLNNPDKYARKSKNNNLKSRGWSVSRSEIYWIKQRGLCAICSRPLKKTVGELDSAEHDHFPEAQYPGKPKARGLLCRDCNRGLRDFELGKSIARRWKHLTEKFHDYVVFWCDACGLSQVVSKSRAVEIVELAAQNMLGVSSAEAFAMLDSGELGGTIAAAELEALRIVFGTAPATK
jgi:hypothetical protein